jgi:hypothetical protein
MATILAEKLRMAATALGCRSRKELCARFRDANPATQCELEPLNKWMQGRSLPRSNAVYADFAAVIGTTKSGSWIADCSIEEFAAELAACTGVPSELLIRPAAPARRVDLGLPGLFGGIATLAGAFAAYSPAWSPHYRGSLIRGSLRLLPGKRGNLIASYAETLLGRRLHLEGEVQIGPRIMDFTLREPEGGAPLFITLHMPGPPASVLCGVMSGAAFVAHESLPSAVRIVFIRVADTPALDDTNRYLPPTPGAVVADLAALGLNIRDAERLDSFMRGFLGEAPQQATNRDLTQLADMLDREYLPPSDDEAHSGALACE